MTDYESITIVVDPKLKRGLESWNFHHKKDKINMSEVCRTALQTEYDTRMQSVL